MTVSYNRLWKLLIDLDMNRTDLIAIAGISSNVLSKMGRKEQISLESLDKICCALGCDIESVVDSEGSAIRYSQESTEKSNGVVYTPSDLAEYLSSSMARNVNKGLVKILDPAIGDGGLVVPLIKKIKSMGDCTIEVVGFELDEKAAESTRNRLHDLFPEVKADIFVADFLEYAKNHVGIAKFDYIIANPPYVRTQILGSEKSQSLSKWMGLSGRVDIYYAFLIIADRLLENDGVAGYITSNKFMTTKAGKCVREYLKKNTRIEKITDFGDTKLFGASVLPCVTIFGKGKTSPEDVDFTTVYQTDLGAAPVSGSIFEALSAPGMHSLKDGRVFRVERGSLCAGDSWTVSTPETAAWLSGVDSKTYCRFSDLGKVKVGIKTTADDVFILGEQSGAEPLELARPLVTHRNAGQIVPSGAPAWSVLYPYDMGEDRRVCLDLDGYPRSREYLESRRERLESRRYVADAGRRWYEIWVPQKPREWGGTKIVFRDICDAPQFWLDEGSIVNGDCYWIAIGDDVPRDLVYLALAVANSRFIERYYDARFNNRLYSGKRRFMSRYVEAFPIPDPESEHSIRAISLVRGILERGAAEPGELDEIGRCVGAAFG
ncbi:MAG: N-6 DNA methylase [Candidatus Methanoplasma sp.]|jgi:DNA-binding Xre family transcriptional regulator|nr:N-6 DNA methylase [Candidatus Methanoplasma sp.]